MEFYGIDPVEMYCMNCNRIVTGYKSRDQTLRVTCGQCGVKYVSRKINKRTIDMRITAPPGQVSLLFLNQ